MSQASPPQNIYDDPLFFEAYSQLERFGPGWTGAFEHRDFMALLPDASGRRVLDLGCGLGQLAHHLAEHGAAEVVGVDLSERMLALAKERWSHPRLTYLQASMELVDFPPNRFDLVVSSLAFHYVGDYPSLCRRIASWLVASGLLVFSTEHPVYLSRATADGWVQDADGRTVAWALDRYGEEGLREENWLAEGVQKYHRMVSSLVNGLIEAGLAIECVVEPMPDAAMLRRHPEWADGTKRPFVLLIRARKA